MYGIDGIGGITFNGEKVTRNRIREVCQLDPNVSEELRDFRVGLLANDLNSIGFLVPVMDKNGKMLSSSAICARISDAIPPHVEDMCVVGNKGSNAGIYKLVNTFNTNYGANIPLKNVNGKSRSVSDLCDDLYLVADRVHNQLSDDTLNVKNALIRQIEALKKEHDTLSMVFAKQLGSLEQGDRYDEIGDKLSLIRSKQSGILDGIDEQIRTLHAEATKLSEEYDANVKSSAAVLRNDLNGYAVLSAMNLIPGMDTTLGKVGKMMDIAKSSGANTGHCTNCINKVFGSYDEYRTMIDDQGTYNEKLQAIINFKITNSNTPAEATDLISCLSALQSEKCTSVEQPGAIDTGITTRDEAMALMNAMKEVL